MRVALQRHPDTVSSAISGIEVQVSRRGPGTLALHYLVQGRSADLLLPPTAHPARADKLWEHTCFEAFVRSGKDEAYCELNFSPSTQWAAYRFASYRRGVREADIAPPRIETQIAPDRFDLSVELALPGEGPLGLSAVVEERSGAKSWWALAHPPGAPDFHHPACFALELPPAPGS